jgi:hypothetical protein
MLEDVGIYNSRFVFYRGKISKGDEPIPETGLALTPKMSQQDDVVVSMGDKIIARSNHADPIARFNSQQLSEGVDVTLLYENTGYDNGGPGMEAKRGIGGWITTVGGASRHTIEDWRSKAMKSFDDTNLSGADVDDSEWDKADVDHGDGAMKPNTVWVYRASVEVSEEQLKDKLTKLHFGRIDDHGKIFVNGESVGDADDWSQPHEFDVASKLHTGKNSIAVVVKNDAGAGGLAQGVSFEPATEKSMVKSTWEFSDTPAGVSGKWWGVGVDEAGWEKVSLGSTSTEPDPKSLLTWYRVKFELPEQQKNVWVPWKIKLEGVGNGFIYLNDHALGRYWQVGPQREYFLPECWLKFGKGQTNVITLCLRPTKEGAGLNNVEVSPYSEWAEKR